MSAPGRRLAELTGLTPLAATTACPEPADVYAHLRARFGPIAPVELTPADPQRQRTAINAWLVLDYDHILQVTRREQLYSRNPANWRALAEGLVPPDSPLLPMMGPRDNGYFRDGHEHRRLIDPITEALDGIDQIAMLDAVRARCQQLIAGFASNGKADLMSGYAAPIPMLAVTDLFGLSPADNTALQRAITALIGSGADSQDGDRALNALLTRIINARRAAPANDLTTRFLHHPDLHTDYEVQQSMVITVVAGWETTTNWITQTLRHMLTDPRFAGQLRHGRLGVDDALDEMLWANPPMANMPARYALDDHELGGHLITRGDPLILGLAAANHDPRARTGNPRLDTGNRAHLAFSAGHHACPAKIPARLIARTAVDTALRLLPAMQLAIPPEDIPYEPSPWARRPAVLPVRFSTPPRT
ncbi:cytochrome P450 [Actinomadura sp. LCR2-06]|uniref:Cytochrome P450 n=1 Tax=Actinomadura violacea TaxID=2819934 RepID=A0ABS3RXP0_9ACTN|nr:cytochrome P450 [Actinomadura violacea]